MDRTLKQQYGDASEPTKPQVTIWSNSSLLVGPGHLWLGCSFDSWEKAITGAILGHAYCRKEADYA